MHDLATIQRMNREAVERANAEAGAARKQAQAEATHKVCGKPVTFNRADISEGDTESFPTGQYGNYYAAACLHCDEDLMEFEIEYPQPTQDERDAAMQRHPAGKARAVTTKPLKPAEAAHLASASAHELAREVLAGFTKNGEIPFALSGQAAADIIAVAIEADRAQRDA